MVDTLLIMAKVVLLTGYVAYGIILLVGNLDEQLNDSGCVPPKNPYIHFALTFFSCLFFVALWPLFFLTLLVLCLWMDTDKFITDKFSRKGKS